MYSKHSQCIIVLPVPLADWKLDSAALLCRSSSLGSSHRGAPLYPEPALLTTALAAIVKCDRINYIVVNSLSCAEIHSCYKVYISLLFELIHGGELVFNHAL